MAKRNVIKQNGPYKVDRGVQMERKREAFTRFPFNKMQVGDSFLVPIEDQEQAAVGPSIYSAANSYNNTHGTKIKMSTRKVEGGVRVWRIK